MNLSDLITTQLAQTKSILQDMSETIDDDDFLVLMVWKRYYPEIYRAVFTAENDSDMLTAFKKLPKRDSIMRHRRTLRKEFPYSDQKEQEHRENQKESKEYYSGLQRAMFAPEQTMEYLI